MGSLQQLLRVSYCEREVAQALKAALPAMRSGFNINSLAGNMSLYGDDAEALADLLEERLRHRLAGVKRASRRPPASKPSVPAG